MHGSSAPTHARSRTNKRTHAQVFILPPGVPGYTQKTRGCKGTPGYTRVWPDMSRYTQMYARIPRHGLGSGLHGTFATQTPRWGAATPQTSHFIPKGLRSPNPPKQIQTAPKGNYVFCCGRAANSALGPSQLANIATPRRSSQVGTCPKPPI